MPFRRITPSDRASSNHATADAPTIDPPARSRISVIPVSPDPIPNRDANGEYIVGKNRPPTAHRFKPGQSGNPRGRPKGAKGLNTLTVEILGAKTAVRTASGEKQMTAVEFALSKLRELAGKGDVRAIAAVLHHWGRAVPDAPAAHAAGAAPAISAADQQIIDMLVGIGIGVVDDRIVADPSVGEASC